MILFTLIRTNLLRLFGSRKSSILILLLPCLLFLLVGLAYQTSSLQSIAVSSYVQGNSAFSSSFIDNLKLRNFEVDPASDELDCISSVKLGLSRACLVFGYQDPPNITFYVDYSNMNLIGDIQGGFNDAKQDYTTRYGLNYTAQLMDRLRAAKKEVDASRPVIVTFATQQDQVNKKLDALTANLAGLTVEFDRSLPDKVASQLNSSNVVSLFKSVNTLKAKVDEEFTFAAQNVSRELDRSAIADSDKQRVKQVVYDAKERVRSASDAFRVTTELTQQDIESFRRSTESFTKNLEEAKESLIRLDNLKVDARKSIRALQADMNANLLQLIMMQNSLNKISTLSDDPLIRDSTSVYDPFPISMRPITQSSSPRLQGVYSSIMVLLLLLSGTILGSTLYVLDVQSPAKLRNSLVPMGNFTYFLGLLLSCVLLLAIQALFMMVLVIFFIGVGSWMTALIGLGILLLLCVFASALGMALGALLVSEQVACLVSTIFVLAMLLFSDVVLPLEAMPGGSALLVSYNPLTLAGDMLKRMFVFGQDIGTQSGSIGLLGLYALLAIIAFLVFSRRKPI